MGPSWLVASLVAGPTLAILALALALFIGPAAPTAAPADATSATSSTPGPAIAASAEEVPGRELPGLPRYPGSVRSDFRERSVGGLLLTDIRYVAPASLPGVQAFYRETLRAAGWAEVDARFAQDSWTYFGTADARELLLRLDQAGDRVLITVEHSVLLLTARPAATAPPAPTAPPDDDDD